MGFPIDLATPKPSVQVGSAQNGWPLGVSINSAPHPPHMSGRRSLSSSIIARLALLVSSRPGEQAIGDKRYLKEVSDRRPVEGRQKFAFKRQLGKSSTLTPSIGYRNQLSGRTCRLDHGPTPPVCSHL